MVEQFITDQLQIRSHVDILDIFTQFTHISSTTAKLLIHRFEKRTSSYISYVLGCKPYSLTHTHNTAYNSYPFSDITIIPHSSLTVKSCVSHPLQITQKHLQKCMEQMLIPAKKGRRYDSGPNSQYFRLSPDPPNISQVQLSNNIHSNTFSKTKYKQIQNDDELPSKSNLLQPTSSSICYSPSISPSAASHFFSECEDDGDSTPHTFINYNKIQELDSWFAKEKYLYIIIIQECAANFGLRLPVIIADFIVIYSILLPGCYTLTGLLFPPARNESDLFAEYANQETGYEQAGSKGIQYKRKKPMINIRRPENNTASLWLDEDGTICGFRCIWVHGIRGKLTVDQKFNVLQGCWSLMGELTIIFEQWDVEDEFEGYLSAETFSGMWTAGKELYGEFQWFITTVESFYLEHNITINDDNIDNDANILDEDDDYFIIINDDGDGCHGKRHVLMGKLFDIEINESLTITCKFLHNEHSCMTDVLCINDDDSHASRHQISPSKTVHLPWNIDQYKMTGKVLEISEKGDIDDEIIGYGEWFNHGKISFPMIKYHTEKLMLSFEGCTDGKKVLGRLCIYHDNTPFADNLLLVKSSSVLKSKQSFEEDIDMDDDIIDDVDGELHSFLLSDITDDLDDDEDDDDDERISFVQMIVVSPVCNM